MFGRLLMDGRADAAQAALERLHPADAATALGRLAPDLACAALNLLPSRRRAEVFGYLGAARQMALLRRMERSDLARLVAGMPHDERADTFRRLPPEEREALLPALA